MKKHKWTIQEQADFLKKTGELLKRGYSLAEAIDSITFQMKKNRKEELIESLAELKEGYPFHKILVNLKFHETLKGFVYFAEQHGSLADAFLDGGEMLLKRSNDWQRLKKMVYYPFFLMVITFFLFVFVERVLLPRFNTLFHSMNLSQNFFMKVILLTGDLFPFIFFNLVALFLFIVSFYFLKFRKYSPMKQKTLLTALPLIGSFYRLINTHYFSVQLGYLLGGGLSILDSLRFFEEHDKHPFDRQMGREMKDHLSRGQKLEDIIKKYSFFEQELSLIVKHGQENGKLDQELFFFSRYCLKKLEEKMDKMMKMVQPILYAVIGGIIVSMYLAILLPMFHLLEGI